MPTAAILGAQWGDEGKGKIVDLFAGTADMVVRFQGGPNAGHTIETVGRNGPLKLVLHHVPSALLHRDTQAIMSRGMVVDPVTLLREIDQVREAGFDVTPERLVLSLDAHIVLPVHRAIDRARETSLKGSKIGTTLRGVGPAYEDRASRRGLRFRDLLSQDVLKERLERLLFERNALLAAYGWPTLSLDEELVAIDAWRDRLVGFCGEAEQRVADAVDSQRVLFEGAQGALLDLSLGSYPFVTSSHTTSGGIMVGTGLAPQKLGEVLGVTKAYITRVGEGPFPSELHDADGSLLAERGREFGATTGRPRRCGWLDLVALRHAAKLCGFTALAVTKLDILNGFERIALSRAYDTPEGRIDHVPSDPARLAGAKPVLETLPGWSDSLRGCQSIEALPSNCRALLDRIAEYAQVPVRVLSVGPARSHSIIESDPLWS